MVNWRLEYLFSDHVIHFILFEIETDAILTRKDIGIEIYRWSCFVFQIILGSDFVTCLSNGTRTDMREGGVHKICFSTTLT